MIKRVRSNSTRKIPSKVVTELEIQTPQKGKDFNGDMTRDMYQTADGLNPKDNMEEPLDLFDVEDQMQVDPQKYIRDSLNFHPMDHSSDGSAFEVYSRISSKREKEFGWENRDITGANNT